MAEIDDLLREHLEAIRADLGTVKTDLRDLKTCFGSLEHPVAGHHPDITRHSVTFDELDARLEGIERRLGLSQ